MPEPADLTRVESHFAFGKNWAAYADKIGSKEIEEATAGLKQLVGGDLRGKKFLDLGCGSGLHSLAATRLGADEVIAVDIDPDSAATAEAVLSRHAPNRCFRVEVANALDMSPEQWGEFDIVYSWGVLHHTGDMNGAIRAASRLVSSDGLFVIALYRRTWLCGFWKWEKAWYHKASKESQRWARLLFTRFLSLRLAIRGQSFQRYIREYRSSRGMDYYHDIHDWMGGYPYESISPRQINQLMDELGFEQELARMRKGPFFGRDLGVFGSGCDEYAYRRSKISNLGL